MSFLHEAGRVDLVGDVAGGELFFIHGEGLLLHCLTEAEVDFEGNSFQLVHAVYAVEKFLLQLRQRGCLYDVVFFDNHAAAFLPDKVEWDGPLEFDDADDSQSSEDSDDSDDSESSEVCRSEAPGRCKLPNSHASKHVIARNIIIQHLQRCFSETTDSGTHQTAVHVFQSLEDEAFKQYLEENTVRYVFCHQGFPGDERSELREEVIYQLVSLGYHVALLKDLTFQSSKIFANLLSGHGVKPRSDPTQELQGPLPRPKEKVPLLDRIESPLLRENLKGPPEDKITLREALGVAILRRLREGKSRSSVYQVAVPVISYLALSREIRLSDRVCVQKDCGTYDQERFLHVAVFLSHDLLHDESVKNLRWDLHDLIDGNMVVWLWTNRRTFWLDASDSVKSRIRLLAKLTFDCDEDFLSHFEDECGPPEPHKWLGDVDVPLVSVLPFSHPALDEYLEPVQITPDASITTTPTASRIFREITHWHNKKTLLDPRKIAKPLSFFAHRRHQWLMSDVVAYSASLTGATGKALNPEVIVCGPKVIAKAKPKTEDKKHGKKTGGRAAALEAAKATAAKKTDKKNVTALSNWKATVDRLEKGKPLLDQYLEAVAFAKGCSDEAEAAVGAEVQLYLCYKLWLMWEEQRRRSAKPGSLSIAAMLWHQLLQLSKQPGRTKQIDTVASGIAALAGLPLNLPTQTAQQSRQLSFKVDTSSEKPSPIDTHAMLFQLSHSGPYMSRDFDSSPDPRVPFAPDAWQREVLDAIDASKSLLVVAPTSAGKTFISFYAMKKILQADDTGVLVYVAPTKALVNQIAAEIAARFTKAYPTRDVGKSVWAIHTRDYRINSALGCQVLVTVPHVLQTMLLSPSNADRADGWSRRVRSIIFDEVHCIGQADDGVVWEQLLLLAPCPVIALSATVGNAAEFRDWLAAAQAQKGYEFKMVVHNARFSDLRKFIYSAPQGEDLPRMLEAVRHLPAPALDEGAHQSQDFRFVHPIAAMLDFSRDILRDVALEPRDCLTLWEAMLKFQTKDFPVDKSLDPKKVLPAVPGKADVSRWEAKLKAVLQTWMESRNSPFMQLRKHLGSSLISDQPEPQPESDDTKSSIIPLVYRLHEQGALPALVFNYNRGYCEERVKELLTHMQAEETRWKESSKEWKQKIADYEQWRKRIEKEKGGKAKVAKEKGSKAEQARLAAEVETSPWASFDPEAPITGFSFADTTCTSLTELDKLIETMGKNKAAPWLIEALRRGVGVHHAGLNRRYRQIVEMLFRRKFLRVVVATGTLALGINMPCKTVVFLGDSVYLTALNYRQASGRAGRRGFDLVGNVVFADIPTARALEVMSLRLPDLRGQFPSSTSLVLRLMGLLHGTGNSDYAVDAVNALLSQTRAYLGGPEARMAVRHHLRFSIEYLRRQHLLSEDGTPLNFSGIVGHLYFVEDAAFAFHALLKGGYFHQLCSRLDTHESSVLLELMLVLSHLFGRLPPRDKSSTLPDLPEKAFKILGDHEEETIELFKGYVRSYVTQHMADQPDNRLPLSGIVVGNPDPDAPGVRCGSVDKPTIRSLFSALSGHRDDSIETVQGLCETVRDGVFLDASAMPHLHVTGENADTNSYLYEFYKHGDLKMLSRKNGIRSGEVWFLLKDFDLVLATIETSLANFMKAEDVEDGDCDDEEGAEEDGDEEKTSVWQEEGMDSQGGSGENLVKVLKAFNLLRAQFKEKFVKIGA